MESKNKKEELEIRKASSYDINFPDNKYLENSDKQRIQKAVTDGGISIGNKTFISEKELNKLLVTDRKGVTNAMMSTPPGDLKKVGDVEYMSTPHLQKEISQKRQQPRSITEQEKLGYAQDCVNAFSNNEEYTPGIAIEQPDVSELLKYDGARTIKMRPWSAYTRTTQFQIENEKVTLTVSIGQTAETNNAENRGAYNLGKVYTFFRFSFENAQGFEKMEKYYIIARKIVAILTSQNNICFEEVYLSQRNSEQKYFKTGICKIFDSYENYSIRQWHKVIPIFSVFDYIPNLIDGIVNGKVNSLLELLPEDNKMVNRISIKNVQDLCTALEVSYQLDDKRKREKDALIEELKKNIKNTIAEFTKAHNEIDVNKETTMSSAFQYLDYTLKQKILTLYNENSDIVDEIVSKYSLPSVNENSIASFVKLRNNKTHSGTVEWGESAKIYTPLFAIVYASFFKYIKLPDEVIKSTLLQIF